MVDDFDFQLQIEKDSLPNVPLNSCPIKKY